MKALDSEGLIKWAEGVNIADESLINFFGDSKQGTKDLAYYQEYLKNAGKQVTTFANITQKAGAILKGFGATLGSMVVMWAVGEVISLAFKAIDDNIHRLDNAKEALSETESQLSDVKSEIESTTEKIKELQSLDTLSILEEEDLQRLKDQNEELRIRQQYLEKQKQLDQDKVVEYTKQKYNYGGGETTQEEIDNYRSLYGGTFTISSKSKELGNLIAQYQYYQEERAKAVSNEDSEEIDKWDTKLKKTTQSLMDSRTTLQEWSDNLGNEASPELEGITSDLERIDNLLISPGQNLVSFINSDSLSKDKEQLVALANEGELTAQVLSTKFPEVDAYFKKNKLTLEDLVSVTKTFKDELSGAENIAINAFVPMSKQEVITNINSLSEGFESLDKIMGSISDKDNTFDYALLDDEKFKKSFEGSGEAYTNFIETISDSPKDVDAAQSSFDNLVTAWVDGSGVLNGLTEENAYLAAAMLQNMGVSNAEEFVTSRLAVAQEHLAAQKAYTVEMSDALANATANEIPDLIDEATYSDVAKVALAGLALEKANANGTTLDTSADIENAISLVNVIGTATDALRAYNKIKAGEVFSADEQKANLNNLTSQTTSFGVSMEVKRQLEAYQEKESNGKSAAERQVQDAINTSRSHLGKGSKVNTIYSGSGLRSGDSSSKPQEEAKQEIDWIAHGTKVVQDSYARLEELAAKDTIAYLGLTQEEFDNAKSIFDNGLGNTAEGLAQLQSYANEAGLSLGELYTMIQSGAPGASKENALQSMLKMQTETLLPQYQREVEAYSKSYSDALKAIPSEYKDKIESGGVDIESLPGDLAKKVQTAIDANEKLKSSEKQLADGEKEHIETIKKLHENKINATDIENEKLEQSNKIIKSQMELMEARGEIVDADFYKRQIENNKGLISGNQQKIDEWESEMADLRAATNFSTNSKDYKELQAKVKAAKNEIQGLKLEQEEWNETLKQMPIDNLSTIISMYSDITAKIENWGTVYTATGQKLDGEYYQTLISNGVTVIEQYGKQAKLVKNLMGEYKKGSTKWQELYKQLQDIDSATSSMLSNLKKYNEELLKMPLDSINTYSESLQKVADGLSNVQSEQDFVIGTVTNAIQKQIDTINDQKNAYQEANESQKKGLQDKLDLLQKQNDQLKRQMAYEQSLYNLQKINQQATELVIRNGQESYEVDADQLREAQEQVASAKFDLETGAIQDQIDSLDEALEKQNELYDSQIEKLEIILNRWSEISEKVKTAQDEAKTSSILGNKWKDQVLSGNDTTLFNTFSGMYQNTAEQLKKYQDQIDSTNNIQSLLEDYVASYKAGEITYSEAVRGINALLSQLNHNMSATGNLQNIFDYLGTVNDTSANADSILKGIQSGLKDTATELLKSMEQYNKNSGIISEHTSSWQKLTSNVEKMLDVLREVRDALENNYDNDDDDDEPYDKSRGKGWLTGDVNNGPGIFADGIKNGLVGSSSDNERGKMIRYLATNELKAGQVPILAHEGEAVLNREQQYKLLENFASTQRFVPNVNIPDYNSILKNVNIADRTTTPVITFNGGINIQECNNGDDLASEILNGGLTMAINQGLGRR